MSSARIKRLRILRRAFFARPTEVVARELLGKVVLRTVPGSPIRQARIVEVEAYLGEQDLASHARRGPTPRAAIMFGPPGHLYVYLIYGIYHCMNVVTETDGRAGAVLIRAAVWLDGPEGSDPRVLSGPGKLCRGLGITRADKGLDLTSSTGGLQIADDGSPDPSVGQSARIGVEYAGVWRDRPLRFFVPDHPSVSGRSGGRASSVNGGRAGPLTRVAADPGAHRRGRAAGSVGGGTPGGWPKRGRDPAGPR